MMRYVAVAVFVMFGFAFTAHAKVVGEEISYRDNDATLKGYLAYDDSIKGKRPGILVVHEWWGHNAYARKRADMLAALGYTALALDMYGDGKTAEHPDKAGEFAAQVASNLGLMKSRFIAARDLLNAHNTVDKARNGAIGYCFGGAVVLTMAREGVDLVGVASFHGSLPRGPKPLKGNVKAKVLLANGADDPFITKEQIAAFKKEMDDAGADYKFINYPNTMHSFTNPGADELGAKFNLPLKYNAESDKASWEEMKKFFKEIF